MEYYFEEVKDKTSSHEALCLSVTFMAFISFLWKWMKSLLVIILMEIISSIILALSFLQNDFYYVMGFILFVFFVCESLILLSSLYGAIRISGSLYGSILFK